VLLPIAGYLFLTGPMWIAILFLVWSLAVSTIDNVLKPILLGQGVDAPLLVIFLGAIGGLLSSGVIGLFLGPVILVLTFTLVDAWARTAPSPFVDP
jgi:predicted PurR-regulated permease PerM